MKYDRNIKNLRKLIPVPILPGGCIAWLCLDPDCAAPGYTKYPAEKKTYECTSYAMSDA